MGLFRSFRVLRRFQMACQRTMPLKCGDYVSLPDKRLVGRRKEARANLNKVPGLYAEPKAQEDGLLNSFFHEE
jgi:hypothetical protein